MAPEVGTPSPEIAFKADSWSIGVILYLLYTGGMDESNMTLIEKEKEEVVFDLSALDKK